MSITAQPTKNESWTAQQWKMIEDTIAECRFPGWEIVMTLGSVPTRYLQVKCTKGGVCNVTGEPMAWNGRKWLLSRYMTKSEVVQTAFMAVMAAMEHELREQFTYRGVTVMQPHRDLDIVVEMSKSVSEREPMPAKAA